MTESQVAKTGSNEVPKSCQVFYFQLVNTRMPLSQHKYIEIMESTLCL